MMTRKRTRDEGLTPLVELVEEGFGSSVGALVDTLSERGYALVVDGSGRLAIADAAAAELRDERDELARIAAEAEREAAAEAERRAAEARAEYERHEAETKAARERQQRHNERVMRLERAAGMPLWRLDREMRRAEIYAPGEGGSLDGRQAVQDRPITLAEMESYVLDKYGADIFEEVTQ